MQVRPGRWIALFDESHGQANWAQTGFTSRLMTSNLAGLDEKTVARGRSELEAGLAGIPDDGRVRKPGGGRPRVEKNGPNSRRR